MKKLSLRFDFSRRRLSIVNTVVVIGVIVIGLASWLLIGDYKSPAPQLSTHKSSPPPTNIITPPNGQGNSSPSTSTSQQQVTKTVPSSASSTSTPSSPCLATSATSDTTSCMIDADSNLDLHGFPAQQNGAYTNTLGGDLTISCSVAASCAYNSVRFTTQTFGKDTYTADSNSSYNGTITFSLAQPINITITVPVNLQTTYCSPSGHCTGPITTNHVFNSWAFTKNPDGSGDLTTNYTSTVVEQ
jgi:cytoskeletal protein RodZ